MKSTETGTWQRTSPFAILYFIGKIIRLIVKNAWSSLAPLFAFFVAYQGDLVSKMLLAVVAVGLAIGTASVLSYWFFRFQLKDDAILIRQGVVKKKQLDIRFERIQGVNIQQNVVFRLLGLVTVSFDTAGSSGNEGNLPAVPRPYAESLRARIGGKFDDDMTVANKVAAEPTTLLQLDWRDMVRIGLADHRALVIFALLGPLFGRLDDEQDELIREYVIEAADGAFQFEFASGVAIVALAAIALVLLLAVFSIAAAFLRYHEFSLSVDDRTLRSHGGLLTRHEHSMDLGKIQTLRLKQGVVQRWQSRFQMTARQAISGRRHGKGKAFTIPVVTARQANALRTRFLSPEAGSLTQNPRSERFAPVSPYFMRSRILYGGLLPAAAAALFFWQTFGIVSFVFLLWLPLVALHAYQSWRRAGYLHDDDEVIRRSGLLAYKTAALLFRKVQRVSVTQSHYQRRKGLATLRMYMASGSVRIPYIEHELANRLRDYTLYKVESSQKPWH